MGIIVTRKGRDARRLQPTGVEKEAFLQEYVASNPECLPLDELGDGLQLLILAREFPTSSGPVDVLAVDRDGWLYVIETKLYRNPDKRTVVAQILDYGAALWRGYAAPDRFISDLDDQLGRGLRQKLRDAFNLTEDECAVTVDAMKAHIEEGSIRFLVLMDRLHDNLRNLIIFLNQNSRFSIYAVEMEFYRHEDFEIVIPRLFGAEVRKEATPGGGDRKKWTAELFFMDAKKRLTRTQLQAVQLLFDTSKQLADEMAFGTGNRCASFSPKFRHGGAKSYYTVRADGTLVLNFGWLHGNGVVAKLRDRFRSEFEKLSIQDLPADSAELFPKVPAEAWTPKARALARMIERVFRRLA